MALGKYNRRTVSASSGAVLPEATVSFYNQITGLPVTAYNDPDGLDPIGSSMTSGSQGEVEVFLTPGKYRITVEKDDLYEEITYEPVTGDIALVDAEEVGLNFLALATPAANSIPRILPNGFTELRTVAQTRSDLDLGGAALLNVGTTAGTVAAGDDSRLSDSREWTAATVDQPEAEAGVATTRRAWTAERVRQAASAWWEDEKTRLPEVIQSLAIADGNLNARMAVSNGLLFLCSYVNNEVQVFSLDDPSNPYQTADFSVSSQPRHIEVLGRFALVACHGAAKIEIYDILDLSSVTKVGEIATGANPKMFEIVGNQIFVACAGSNTLEKFTVYLPSTGTFNYYKNAELSISGGPISVAHNGAGMVAVSCLSNANITLVNKDTLALLSSTSFGGTGHPCCVWYNETQLLVTDTTNNQLHSIDCSNPSAPVIDSSIAVVIAPEQIQIVGQRCHIPSLTDAGVPSLLSTVDLSDAKNPVEIGQTQLTVCGAGFTAHFESAGNSYLYVNGHFSPYNLEVLEVLPEFTSLPGNSANNSCLISSASISELSASHSDILLKYATYTTSRSLVRSDPPVLRFGSFGGPTVTLPDPGTMLGKMFTIKNVHGSSSVTVSNAFLGFSGTLDPGSSVTILASDFGGGNQWDAIGSGSTIVMPVARGGTGANTATGARTNLGLNVTVPSGPTASGEVGQTAGDANYIYRCIATDTWIRVPKDATWV